MFLGSKQSIRNTIKVSWSVCAKMCERKGLHSGETRVGFSTTITHWLIVRSRSGNFWQISKFLCLRNRPITPYSSDLAPADFYLFPKLKISLKGMRFDSIENIQANPENVLNTLKKENFHQCFQKWKRRCNHCVQSEACMYCHFEITQS